MRQTIITDMITRLEAITTVNSYNTNIGNNIFEWREYPTDTSNYPCLIIKDVNENFESMGHHVHDHTLTIEWILYTSGSSCQSDMRKAISDVYSVIGDDLSWNKVCYDTEIESMETSKEHQESEIMSTIITLVLKYKTPAWDNTKVYEV